MASTEHSSTSESFPATADGQALSIHRELVMERARRHVFESIAREELLAHTLSCLLEMIEREMPRFSAAVLIEPDLGDLSNEGVAGKLEDPILAAGAKLFSGRSPARSVINSVAALGDRSPQRVDASSVLAEMGINCNAAWAAAIIQEENDEVSLLGIFLLLSKDGRDEFTAAERALVDLATELAGFAIGHRRRTARAAHRQLHDPLTDLPNLTLLKDRMEQVAEMSRRQGNTLVTLLVDLDGLRSVNEDCGRGSGDDVIRQFARRLQKNLRRCDTIARTGGDKFVIIAQVTNGARDAAALARKVLSVLSAPVKIGEREIALAANAGVSLFPTDGETPIRLLDAAEVAVHRAKKSGRNTFQFFQAGLDDTTLADLEMQGQLQKALESNLRTQRQIAAGADPSTLVNRTQEETGRLMLQYQPQVNQAGELIGVEALARWTHPKFGRIAPDRFIAVAEENGLIGTFGEWALREALAQWDAWHRQFGPRVPKIAVNVSASQFADEQFVAGIEKILSGTPCPPGAIELEITESVLMSNAEEASSKIKRLRELGLSVALDDFGTGYSSLSYLHRLTMDKLKVDRSFVAGLTGGERRPPGSAVDHPLAGGTAVIRAIISMGRSLGMTVLAEGVETDAQRQLLCRLGCEQMQGYLFSRAVEATEIATMLSRALPLWTEPLAAVA
jgi:diguanylate cyclase (GGDEF)-like protein